MDSRFLNQDDKIGLEESVGLCEEGEEGSEGEITGVDQSR